MRQIIPLAFLALLAGTPRLAAQTPRPTTVPAAPCANAVDDARTILERYVRAWRGPEEMALQDTVVLGFRIRGQDGGDFHVTLSPAGSAELDTGASPAADEESDVTFETDMATLRRLDCGKISAFTAMGRGRATDPAPLLPRFPEGFRWTPEAQALYLPLAFHFWNRDWPEVVRFGEGHSRLVHGANAAILYYDQGLRTAWYQLKPGMHINEDPELQANPFPSLFIITRGTIQARIGGQERTLREGEAAFVPPGTAHEFWVGDGGYGEFIIVMFGTGA